MFLHDQVVLHGGMMLWLSRCVSLVIHPAIGVVINVVPRLQPTAIMQGVVVLANGTWCFLVEGTGTSMQNTASPTHPPMEHGCMAAVGCAGPARGHYFLHATEQTIRKLGMLFYP